MSGYDDPAWRAEQQAKAQNYYAESKRIDESNRIANLEAKYGQTMHAMMSPGRWALLTVIVAVLWLCFGGSGNSVAEMITNISEFLSR